MMYILKVAMCFIVAIVLLGAAVAYFYVVRWLYGGA